MSPLPVTLACGPYDRTRALADGRVTVAGADLRYVTLDPEEIFFRMVSHGEFDVSEMSMATFHVITDKAGRSGTPAPFVAIPVFPSRMFRHASVYVNTDRLPAALGADPAAAARALAGATVGVAEWQLTANVWIRGILADFYGVPVESVRYFAATGIFPIMHVIVIRRAVYEANRWLARELFKAFTAAKELAYGELARTAALAVSLPFAGEEYERATALMGTDYWAYGIERNRRVLAAFARYAAAQHLIASAPEDLFAPEMNEEVII